LTAGLTLVVATVVVAFALLKMGGKPPDVEGDPRQDPNAAVSPNSGQDGEISPATASPSSNGESATPVGRRSGVYTFLVLGMDDGNGNTDTFMVATLDTVNHTLNVVNMPRDTVVNVSWNTKKINTLYANLKIEGTVERLASVIGYKVDRYAVVDMKAFKALIDSIGGVDFNVPVNMSYDDPAQSLSIHFNKGVHHLTGEEALRVLRYRGYSSADIGRISTQQDFLMAAAKQILASKNSVKVVDLANIFIKYVKTDLSLQNIIWLASELYKLDAENITFTTMPGNYIDSVGNNSYVTIYVDEWLEIINSKLNPFTEPIKLEELSILTRNSSGAFYSTDGHYEGKQSWGQSGGSSSKSSSGQSGAASTPTPTPTPTPSPPAPERQMEDGEGASETDISETPPSTTDTGGDGGVLDGGDASPSASPSPSGTDAPPSDSPQASTPGTSSEPPPSETPDTGGTNTDGDSPPDWLG
jgi:LCP family protein required for cell wall assembly